ncbi:MAG: hypothetical protein ACC707_17005 [Thiohalomonadales bacterium]
MACPDIKGLKLDHSSREALSEINRITELSRVLANIMGYGTILNIVTGKGGFISGSYNLSSTDFSALDKALTAISKIQRTVIQKIARNERASHWGNEALFWEAIHDGCQ